jgi:hypothetical protein
MIGTKSDEAFKKICKVSGRVADEASEQRGSYYKVGWALGETPHSLGMTPEAGNPNQLAQKENFNGFGCPE